MPGGAQSDSSSVTRTGATTINGSSEELTQSYTASESDQSVILVENGGNLTLDGAEVSKTGGDSSNTENSEFYGVNAGILVTQNSTATIKNTTISTNAKGSNAVFSTGTDSKIYISNSKITTTGSGSARGLNATYGGYIEADNVIIKTLGGSCATLATDRGEGTINSDNTAKTITLKLDSNSTITLTGDSYITSLEDSDTSYSNINFNGYKLYVNGTAIN